MAFIGGRVLVLNSLNRYILYIHIGEFWKNVDRSTRNLRYARTGPSGLRFKMLVFLKILNRNGFSGKALRML